MTQRGTSGGRFDLGFWLMVASVALIVAGAVAWLVWITVLGIACGFASMAATSRKARR